VCVEGERVERMAGRVKASKKIDLEALFAQQLEDAGISFQRQFRFCPTRLWRADFLIWPAGLAVAATLRGDRWIADEFFPPKDRSALVQIDGGGQFGGHGTSKGIRLACERDSAAACMGFRVLRADKTQVNSRELLRWALCAIGRLDKPEVLFGKDGSDRSVERLTASLPFRVRRAAGLA
jgi:hypothetical protein